MPAAALVLPVLEFVAPEAMAAVTGAVGGAVASTLGAGLASTTILGATTVADVATGAIIGAGTSAASAAIQGGDIVKAAEAGAVGGGLTPVVSGAINSALGAAPATGGYSGIPETPAKLPSLAGSVTAGEMLSKGVTPLVTGTAAGVATGQTPEAAFKASIPSAIGGALSAGAQYGLGVDSSTSNLIGQLGSTGYKYATTPSPSYPSYQAPPSPGLSGQGPAGLSGTGPSATLGQSLSIAPTLGYTPGGTVFGSSEGDQPKQRVWNVASLRNIGEEA